MKASITKQELVNALTIVSKGMSSRSTLPILSGIYISAQEKELVFQTTDLEISISTAATAFVEVEGKTVAPGKLLTNIVKNLPDAAVQFSLEGEQLVVECASSRFVLNTLNPEDFPHFPEVQTNKEISFPTGVLGQMVKRVSRAISRDETRAVLTGIYLAATQNDLKLVATDSYRLAIAEETLREPLSEATEMIVPGRIFDEIMKLAEKEEQLAIGIAENQIVFTFGETTFITRKIEGNFPNFNQLLSADEQIFISVPTTELVGAIKRVSLLADDTGTAVRFKFNEEEQLIEIFSNSQDIGGAKETISAQIEGGSVEIGFNYQFILDGLDGVDAEETRIEVQPNPVKPGIFKNMGKENYLYLAMPLRLDA